MRIFGDLGDQLAAAAQQAQAAVGAKVDQAKKQVESGAKKVEAQVSRASSALDEAKRSIAKKLAEGAERLQTDDGGRSSAGRIGWLKSESPAPTRDVSGRFDQLFEAAKAGDRTLPDEASDHVYLLVPGLFTERFPGYLDENQQRLEDLGLDTERVDIDTDASVEQNAAAVRDAILEASKDGRQVVLIGHSKGGVDASAALAMYPELKPHVRAMVAMQTPYAGSPIANDIMDCPTAAPYAKQAIETLFQGDVSSLGDLSYDKRQAFLARYPHPQDVPTVSLATSNDQPLALTSAASAYVETRYGAKGDGLVAQADAEIPGSSVVRLKGVDHAMAGMKSPEAITRYQPGDMTQALVTLALTTPASA